MYVQLQSVTVCKKNYTCMHLFTKNCVLYLFFVYVSKMLIIYYLYIIYICLYVYSLTQQTYIARVEKSKLFKLLYNCLTIEHNVEDEIC